MRYVFVTAILLLRLCAHAQPYVGINSFFAYPFDVAKQGFYNTASAGGSITVGYLLKESKVYPSATFSMSYVQQPIYSKLFNDINTASVYKNFSLSLNNILYNNEQKRLVSYVGINAVNISINSTGVQSNVSNTPFQLVSDGINYLYPGIHGGLKYIGSLKLRNLYWTADAYIGYIRVFESNNYRLVNDNYYEEVTIEGNVLNPAIMLGLQYEF